MPLQNLGRAPAGNLYIDRSVRAVRWLPIDTYTSAEGGPAKTFAVKDYLEGDVNTVVTQGNFEGDVFTTSGTNLDLVVTATPRASVMDGEQLLDTLTLRATGIAVNSVTPAPVDATINVVTFDLPTQRTFWVGNPGRSVNESTTTLIGLSQFIRGIPDNSFDSVAFVSNPSVNWVTLENANGTMARLKIVAPAVSSTMQIPVSLRVTDSDSVPTTDDITFNITVIDLSPTADAGINVLRWDMPTGPVVNSPFVVSVLLDQPLGEGDTLVPSDFYVDSVANVSITAVAVDSTDNKKYNLTCTAAQNTFGIATLGLVRS